MTVMLPSLIHSVIPALKPPPSKTSTYHVAPVYTRTMDDFLEELKGHFEGPLSTTTLLELSEKLQAQFAEKLRDCPSTMLPSYIHTLPTGAEQGNYLALDVGGSTFRVALVELGGVAEKKDIRIKNMTTSKIDSAVRALEGVAFFNWMATRISEMLAEYDEHMGHGQEPLAMGLAWSFPIEQTSLSTGKLHVMGKGLYASRGLEGQDLAQLIVDACKSKNLNVRMDAIVNDSAATLLSRAYYDQDTRLALILGTGTNAAIHIPVSALGAGKFGDRPTSWHAKATHVLVNTEFSMCGKNILPTTRWDDYLDANHSNPGYQPYEHLIGGRYLGEIMRLVLLEAIQTVGLFGGTIPARFLDPYSLDTGTLAVIEADLTPTLTATRAVLMAQHPLPHAHNPSLQDLRFLRAVALLVTRRAAAFLAVAIHALWAVRARAEHPAPLPPHLSIGCNGSVIEKYPGFRQRTQQLVDDLTTASGAGPGRVGLEVAGESAIFGAAVAAACALE